MEFSAHNPFGSAPFRLAQERIKTSRPGLGGPARFVSLSLSLTCQLSASLVSLGFLSYSFESFPSSLPFPTPHNNTLGPSPAPRRHCQQPSTVTPRSQQHCDGTGQQPTPRRSRPEQHRVPVSVVPVSIQQHRVPISVQQHRHESATSSLRGRECESFLLLSCFYLGLALFFTLTCMLFAFKSS